ncbi:MAG TPA: ABC transporter permease subunit, partial [Acidimicrobiia bacterium]
LAITLVVGSFFADSFAPLVEELAGLEKLTPFYWFLQGDPLLEGPSPSFAILAAGSGLFAALAGVLFQRRDVRAEAPVVSLPGVPFVEGGRSRRPSRLLRSIYRETTWERRKSLWAWLGGLAVLSGIVMAFYPAIASGAEQDAFQALLDAIPEELLALFGITEPESLLTAAGFISSRVYSSIGLLLMIAFAVGMGRSALAGEEERGTADLLVSMPVSRRRIVTERFLGMVTLVGFLSVWLTVVVAAGNQIFVLDLDGEAVVAANLGMGLIGLVFGSLALAVGAVSGRPGVTAAVAGGAAAATFFLNGLAAAIDPLAPLRPLSPFYWYLGESTPLATGFSATFGLLAVLTITFFIGAVLLFDRRNLGT